jgi:hypothetical protein
VVNGALAIVPMILTRSSCGRPSAWSHSSGILRTHSDEQIDQIAASMREFGFLWSITVNGDARSGARPLVMNEHKRPHVVTMCDRDDVAFYLSKHVLPAHTRDRRRASK